ncbi:type IV pilus assembly protein PilW [Ectothiorhodospira mobilis]|uniref:Type IV pilus assembly protein PilW n=1 Tax=Ectothiorhodospira mobilis TaxID=195064 RepID=A0A1I4SHQ5_ECTMO|nr:prepilin-type N-terminal cleavage/methylation domain-containing protein [Ectothiorhodospira mobilis]SFM64028.1 type IV pilus assembly protein PilW [Ectothiorhodospira mobilis]
MNAIPRHHRSRGFSLVEWMVALVIGLILLAGALQVFLAHQTTYRETQRWARLQETLAFVTEYLTRDLRGAEGVHWSDGELRVTRDRRIDWCGADPGVHTVRYWIEDDALRCRSSTMHNHELIRGFRPGSRLEAALLPDAADPTGVRIDLVFQSHAGEGANPRTHRLSFHVALRNRVLARIQSPP